MQHKELILAIGPKRYRDACAIAVETAGDTGMEMPPSQRVLWEIPHEVIDLLWAQEEAVEQMLDQAFAVYEEMPTYGLLSALSDQFEILGDDGQSHLFEHHRRVLGEGRPTLARPMEYALWTDYLQSPDRVDLAWSTLMTPPVEPALMTSLLVISGPVPYDLKAPIYDRLIQEPSWHHAIFLSILHSKSETYGQCDDDHAREIVKQLQLPPDTGYLDKLQRALNIRPGLKIV